MAKSKQLTTQKSVKHVVPKVRKKKANGDPTGDVEDLDSDKENNNCIGMSGDMKKPRVMIHWSKPDNHHLTDQLLTLIEDSPLWKAVFGFDKGTSGSAVATGKGKSTLKHCADIAVALFIDYVAGYEARCEDELIDGSPAANVYDVIKTKFPWYCRMHELMGSSPVVSRKAVSNSKSSIDLTVLDHNSQDTFEDEYEHVPSVFDEDDDPLQSPLTSSSPTPATPLRATIILPSKCLADTPTHTKSASKKRKSVHDMVREVADAEREARLVMNKINAKERTALERMRVEQAAAQRAHELVMIEKQIELERIRAGIHVPIDLQLH
ncbi:uncharacterized protein EDB91DRAFT_1084053 [Suillus paluster]|uniref:uncharacterized protein n=1 Tax=Suillus paluster TaxID=48578 RepID=UPI001B86A0CB|nr:uncharacterized protein EDB91DRAFT_1084053 [Suillus paluster]KAG1734393.1 hypothetical protein EDB91DRAFT_1084053 [Suillus paluster]